MSEYFSGSTRILKGIDTVPDRRGGSRRLYQRYQVTIDTTVECGNKLYNGTMIEISKSGCRVIIDNINRPETSHVTLKFLYPGELDTRTVKGKIKWKKQKENSLIFGIEFEKLQKV